MQRRRFYQSLPLPLALSLFSLLSLPLLSTARVLAQTLPLPQSTPDWTQLTFRSLPAYQQSGSFTATPDIIGLLGYDPSREWRVGQTPAEVQQLGDLGSLALQQFTLEQISALTGLDLTTVNLADLELLGWQTLEDLADAMPGLANVRADSLPGVRDVLTAAGITNSRATLGQLVQSPSIASLELNQTDLSDYTLIDLPGLTATPLQNFADYQRSTIAGVPGLSDVPFAQFPGAAALQNATPALTDIVFGPAEGDINRSISGSYEEGFNVPCQQNCAHIELGLPFEGFQWVSGLSQQVRGGHGFLGSVNNGLEPTGRHPFGDGFKVAVLNTDETAGTAETGLYFRFCIKRRFVDLGCTPYFIGPVPWLPIQEEGMTLL